MKKNDKAFTLIELLAIIVILAIIAVITVPIILNIIENSKIGAATDSAYGYKDAVSKWYVTKLSEDQNATLNGTYAVVDGKLDGTEIPLSGDKPTSGTLTYENGVFKSGCLVIGEYTVTFNEDGTTNTDKGECSEIEYGYKSFDTVKREETEIMIGTSGYAATGKNVFLRYVLKNGEVATGTVPEVCIYGSTYGGELCLKYNKKEESIKKMKAYFKWNDQTNSSMYEDVTCDFNNGSVDCQDSFMVIHAFDVGSVYAAIFSESFGCDVVSDDDEGSCD